MVMIDVTSFSIGFMVGAVVATIIWVFNPFGRR